MFALGLTLAFNIGYANTNGTEKNLNNQEQEQEGRRKGDQSLMRPDGDVASQATSQGYQQETTREAEPAMDAERPVQMEEKSDSVEDDSVSKYNFIFYFLYKFKYDAEEAP